jgi:hypothetical protein
VLCHLHDPSPIKFASCSAALLTLYSRQRSVTDGSPTALSSHVIGIAHIHMQELPGSTDTQRQSVVYLRLAITPRAHNHCQRLFVFRLSFNCHAKLRCRVISYLLLSLLGREPMSQAASRLLLRENTPLCGFVGIPLRACSTDRLCRCGAPV